MRQPSVTIGMPVYDGGASLTGAIETLLGQEFGDFELIISDNASTDCTSDLCQAFANADTRVRYVRQERNLGALRNFEVLRGMGRGEYFMWSAADDVHHPTFIMRCRQALEENPSAVLAMSDIKMQGRSTSTHYFADDVASPNRSVRLSWILRSGGWGAIYGLIRRSVLDRCRLFGDMPPPRPFPCLSIDYLVVELALIGPFAHVSGALLTCTTRELASPETLAHKLEPDLAFDPYGAFLTWYLRDLWGMGQRHRLPIAERLSLMRTFLASALSSGTLNLVLRTWTELTYRNALQNRHWNKLPRLAARRWVTSACTPRHRPLPPKKQQAKGPLTGSAGSVKR